MDGANGNAGFGWMLVGVRRMIAGLGLTWLLAPHLPRLGRLPGDIVIERGNSRFYFPIVTCILISVVLSLMMWVFRALSRRGGPTPRDLQTLRSPISLQAPP